MSVEIDELVARILTVGRTLHALRPWTYAKKVDEFRVEAPELGLATGIVRIEENVERLTILTALDDQDAPVLRLEFPRLEALPSKLREAFEWAGAEPGALFPFVIRREDGEDGAPTPADLRLVAACVRVLGAVYSEHAASFRDVAFHFARTYSIDGADVHLAFPHV